MNSSEIGFVRTKRHVRAVILCEGVRLSRALNQAVRETFVLAESVEDSRLYCGGSDETRNR